MSYGPDSDHTLLALDLSMNYVGWCRWSTRMDYPMDWGHFQIKKPKGSGMYGAKRILGAAESFNKHMGKLVAGNDWPDVIVYERTDWRADLWQKCSHGPSAFKKAYAQELRARDSLNQAEGLLAQYCAVSRIRLMDIGANEVKAALEAKRKDAVARVVSSMFPNYFTFLEDAKPKAVYFLRDDVHSKKIRHDTSDAIAIAAVAARHWHLSALIDEFDRG